MGGIIDKIDPASIAEELGWQPGDEIISINCHSLADLIDYRFYSAEERLNVLVRRGDETAEFEVDKDIDTGLGVTFEDALFDGVRTCGAKCIFCFVDQLPKGLRKSLYLKDDDYRLSFLHGNFVTLANVTEDDLKRIVTQRLSPLYISAHTTDPALRERMLGRSCPPILEQIDTLACGAMPPGIIPGGIAPHAGGITLHTQIVLCRGINDGEHLDRTIADLAARYPTVRSIAIVPAGVTAHRRNKTPIGSIDAQYSVEILCKVQSWQHKFSTESCPEHPELVEGRRDGTRLVWAADEFYLSAGRRVPKASTYEGFPQIENGVGLVRKFLDSAYRAKRLMSARLPRPIMLSIITGTLAAPVVKRWADSLNCENLTVNVYPITNRLFGDTVTVTGLIAGQDVIDQLMGKPLGDLLVIPSVALRDGAFLDDVTLGDLERALAVKVLVSPPTPLALVKLLKSELRTDN